MVIMHMCSIWFKLNGFKERNAPPFIVHDFSFHSNYQKFGCSGNDYLGRTFFHSFLRVLTEKSAISELK